MKPEKPTQFLVALERYIDGSATEADVGILNAGIESDPSLRELFILTLYRDEAIYRIAEDRMQSELASTSTLSRQSGSAENQVDKQPTQKPDPGVERRRTPEGLANHSMATNRRHRQSRFTLYLAGAAVAAIVTVAFYPLVSQFLLSGQQSPGGGPKVSIPDIHLSPARLIHAHQMSWADESMQANADQSLDMGEYQIESGFLQFEMATGVTVIMHAPAEFSIDSPSEISLTSGALSAKVNEGAEGFVVNTPSGEVLDLGTEFGVAVRNNDAVEVHVMDGEVVASLPGKKQVQSLQIGQAGRMEADIGEISLVEPRIEKFARDWKQIGDSLKHSGAVWYLYEPPKSVVHNNLEDEDRLFILPERIGFTLPVDVRCELFTPGEHTTFLGITTNVPRGATVDSYLLHFDRAEDVRGSVAVAEGSVTFDRPILGVIVSRYILHETDSLLGHPAVQYPKHDARVRGLEHGEFNKDIVHISEDSKTITVRLEAELHMDQVRVLVQSDR